MWLSLTDPTSYFYCLLPVSGHWNVSFWRQRFLSVCLQINTTSCITIWRTHGWMSPISQHDEVRWVLTNTDVLVCLQQIYPGTRTTAKESWQRSLESDHTNDTELLHLDYFGSHSEKLWPSGSAGHNCAYILDVKNNRQENSLVVPREVKHRITIGSSNSPLMYILQRIKNQGLRLILAHTYSLPHYSH